MKKMVFSISRSFSFFLFAILTLHFTFTPGSAAAQSNWRNEGWQMMVFAGRLSTNEFKSEILQKGYMEFEDSGVAGIGISK